MVESPARVVVVSSATATGVETGHMEQHSPSTRIGFSHGGRAQCMTAVEIRPSSQMWCSQGRAALFQFSPLAYLKTRKDHHVGLQALYQHATRQAWALNRVCPTARVGWHGAEKHVSNGPKLMSRLLYTSSVSGSVQVPSLSGQTGQHSPSVLIGSWQLGSSQSIWASEMVPSVHMNIEQGSLSVVHDAPSRCRTPALSVQVPSPGRVVVSVSGHTGPNVSVCRPGKRDRESRAERELA